MRFFAVFWKFWVFLCSTFGDVPFVLDNVNAPFHIQMVSRGNGLRYVELREVALCWCTTVEPRCERVRPSSRRGLAVAAPAAAEHDTLEVAHRANVRSRLQPSTVAISCTLHCAIRSARLTMGANKKKRNFSAVDNSKQPPKESPMNSSSEPAKEKLPHIMPRVSFLQPIIPNRHEG